MLATKGPLIEAIRGKRGFICDMDGVIYHGRRILPGVIEFVNWLQATGKPFLFLTNSSEKTPHELSRKLHSMGLQVGESHFYTSALATADFVSSQSPGSSAYVIGDSGLMGALHDAGIVFTDIRPDYVIIGETRTYGYDSIRKAMNLVMGGARLIGTNPDISGPSELGVVPGLRRPYFTNRNCDRQTRVFHWQAESADDADRTQVAWRSAQRMRHHRGPHGHRYRPLESNRKSIPFWCFPVSATSLRSRHFHTGPPLSSTVSAKSLPGPTVIPASPWNNGYSSSAASSKTCGSPLDWAIRRRSSAIS